MPMERRRVNNHSDDSLKYSPQSILHAVEKFSSAVGSMEHNVLIPCRLQDVSDPNMGDLHAAYKLLTKTKMDILFGDDSRKLSSRNLRSSRSMEEQPKTPTLTSSGHSAPDSPADNQNSPPNELCGGNADPKMVIMAECLTHVSSKP